MILITISQRFLNQLMLEPEWEGVVWEYAELNLEWWGLHLWVGRN